MVLTSTGCHPPKPSLLLLKPTLTWQKATTKKTHLQFYKPTNVHNCLWADADKHCCWQFGTHMPLELMSVTCWRSPSQHRMVLGPELRAPVLSLCMYTTLPSEQTTVYQTSLGIMRLQLWTIVHGRVTNWKKLPLRCCYCHFPDTNYYNSSVRNIFWSCSLHAWRRRACFTLINQSIPEGEIRIYYRAVKTESIKTEVFGFF